MVLDKHPAIQYDAGKIERSILLLIQ